MRDLRGQTVSMVFEDPLNSLDPAYTVGSLIGEALILHKGLSRREARTKAATVVRALETVTDMEGVTWRGEGWTRLVITPQRGIRAVNGLLTGLHEPRSSHLAMLEALVGRAHLEITYASALREHYLWHEFGDVHLILPFA